jgi:hypothetical protein
MKSNDMDGKVLDENNELFGVMRNVGFYNSIKSGSQTVHIETEVTVGSEIKITTKTWTDGSMTDMIVQIFDPPEEDIVPNLMASAELQHNRAIEKAELSSNPKEK